MPYGNPIFDMFAGIGGFRTGLESIGGFACIGHCEIDKYANQAYNAMYETGGEYYCADARQIDPDTMPGFDLICAGFPCQSYAEEIVIPKFELQPNK